MKNYKILVVDDDIASLTIHIEYLIDAEKQYEILQANSGKLALKIIDKVKPDLILLDWEMPDISGLDVIREIRKNEETKDIAVIVITGMMTSSNNLQEALESGAIDFMRKPVDKIEFNARVRSMLKLIEFYNTQIENEIEINNLLNDKIDFKNRELVSNTLLLAKQNTETIKIIEEIQAFNKVKIPNEFKLLINQTLNALRSNVDQNIWEDFKLRFENVHPKFLKHLLNDVPSLSPTEQKLSILLKLNLSSKEIAEILSIQVDSVKTARSRLRKKLPISNENNLTSYLSSL